MRPATFHNALLLLCGAVGIVLITFACLNRFLWINPTPDDTEVILMARYNMMYHRAANYPETSRVHVYPRLSASLPNGSTVLLDFGASSNSRINNVLEYYGSYDGVRVEVFGDRLRVYLGESRYHSGIAAWDLELTDQTLVMAAGKTRTWQDSYTDGLGIPAGIQVTDTTFHPYPSTWTGKASAIYLGPTPSEIVTAKDSLFRQMLLGGFLCIVGMCYFFRPGHGSSRIRQDFSREEPFEFSDI